MVIISPDQPQKSCFPKKKGNKYLLSLSLPHSDNKKIIKLAVNKLLIYVCIYLKDLR